MEITVKLFGASSNRSENSKQVKVPVPEGTNVIELLNSIEVNMAKINVIFVNGKQAQLNRILVDGDSIMALSGIAGG